jgi:SagB-type dehydrogenase family enzyme
VITIVEPHHDDAVLSMGGTLCLFRDDVELVTVFGHSNSARAGFRPKARESRQSIAAVRQRESVEVCRELGITHHDLGFQDYGLRGNGPAEESDNLFAEVLRALAPFVAGGGLLFFPAGFGDHHDHRLLRRIADHCGGALLYEDLCPIGSYAGSIVHFWPVYTQLREAYTDVYVDITATLPQKIQSAQLYESQFVPEQVSFLRAAASATARSQNYLASGRWASYAERFYVPNAGLRGSIAALCTAVPGLNSLMWRRDVTVRAFRPTGGGTSGVLPDGTVSLGQGAELAESILERCAESASLWEIAASEPRYSPLALRRAACQLAGAGLLDCVPPPASQAREIPLAERHNLPAVFRARRTHRNLAGRPIPLDLLADMLLMACRSTGTTTLASGVIQHYPFPTAGGLGSTSQALLCWDIGDLTPGIYTYARGTHSLVPAAVRLPTREQFYHMVHQQDWVFGAAAAVVLTCDRLKCQEKYGERADRLLLLEAGHCSQALHMACTELDLGCVLLGGFSELQVSSLLPGSAWPVAVLLVGRTVDGPSPAEETSDHAAQPGLELQVSDIVDPPSQKS